jgi:hypothetical protein
MPYYLFLWNDLIEEHLAEHGVLPDEFEAVVCDPESVDTSSLIRKRDRIWRGERTFSGLCL